MVIITKQIDTQLGPMRIGVDPDTDSLVLLDFLDRKSIDQLVQNRVKVLGPLKEDDHVLIDRTRDQLVEYFNRDRQKFDLPLQFIGTAFQQQVWTELLEIPYGQTRSYGEMAKHMGKHPASSRAIGAANGMNAIAIVVPCHRVIGTDGSLVGYGGGLGRKRQLLDLESGKQLSLDTYF